MIGLGRVIANELPMLACRRIEIAPDLDDAAAADALAAELDAADAEAETSWTRAGPAGRRRGCAGGCRRSRAAVTARWRWHSRNRAFSTVCAGAASLRRNPGRVRWRSRYGRQGSISAT